jgi:hypothetical protein
LEPHFRVGVREGYSEDTTQERVDFGEFDREGSEEVACEVGEEVEVD